RPYCPTCGASPAMAQLVGVDPGRKRLLVCGRCRTRWQFRRTACPFCGADAQRLESLMLEGEAGLRVHPCAAGSAFLQTRDGQTGEDLLLLDWTSVHLDVIARDRGLKRMAASLYELPAAGA